VIDDLLCFTLDKFLFTIKIHEMLAKLEYIPAVFILLLLVRLSYDISLPMLFSNLKVSIVLEVACPEV
jgi:hypothetical protein